MSFFFAQIASISVIFSSFRQIAGKFEHSSLKIWKIVAIMKTRILDIYFFAARFVIKTMEELTGPFSKIIKAERSN